MFNSELNFEIADLCDANPNPVRDKQMVSLVDIKMLKSLRYLCDVIEEGLHIDLNIIKQRIELSIVEVQERNKKIRCTVYALHSELVHAVKNNDLKLIDQIIQYANIISFFSEDISISTFNSAGFSVTESNLFKAAIGRNYQSDGYNDSTKKLDLEIPSPENTDYYINTVQKALDALNDVDKLTYQELTYTISDIIIVKSNTINAGSSFRALGAIYLNELKPHLNWTAYLENIVHEQAHNHLFYLWSLEALLEEGGELYKSPLRKDLRPLSGIYHAMFVLARTIRMIKVFKQSKIYKDEIAKISTSYNQAKNSASFEDKFIEAYNTLNKNAKLTPKGKKLMNSSLNIAITNKKEFFHI